jgi:GT2 family glycosyltransferase
MKTAEPIVSAIVLNYLTWQQTLHAVEDLLAQSGVALDIVIVDNASPNDSLEQLEQRFGRDERVAILARSDNGGYARGNNHGARWRLAAASQNTASQNTASPQNTASAQSIATAQSIASAQSIA